VRREVAKARGLSGGRWAGALALLVLLAAGCFGAAPQLRHYYTLYVSPLANDLAVHVPGTVYVRDLDAESAYDKFQIVVRTSPFELSYRESQVWAVRPNRMVSDLVARTLLETRVFDAVTRELGSRRPDYILGGNLHALEVYDSTELWFAHLALTFHVVDFRSGQTIWAFSFDDRKQVFTQDFSSATRALSELLSLAISRAIASFGDAINAANGPPAEPPPQGPPPAVSPPPKEAPPGVIYVPEPAPTAEPTAPGP
jgi:ABC-type uncharacterized transport system auxiliary subunit